MTKMTWGNPVALAAADAERLGVKDGDGVRIEVGKTVLETQVVVQPGQAVGVACLELGYGRETGNVAASIGANGFKLMDPASPAPAHIKEVKLTTTGTWRKLPRTQEIYPIEPHRFEGKELVWAMTLAEREKAARETVTIKETEAKKEAAKEPAIETEKPLPSLYPEQEFKVEKWGMSIDLSSCVGCEACMIACQSENNVPVVGPEQVIKGREMHWIRIDRYYSGPPENVEVAHQPMMCQQCDHAPCETVCPTLATVHSDEGLNQQIYNRCVGTRYCANNCPYKVRRFNWFNYPREDRLANLVLNPDVTVRTRGVMEKCTFCVQRIQEAKIEAKRLGAPVKDGDIRTACEQACPAGAIGFGDLNDPNSRVACLARDARQYRVLEDLNVGPAVRYLKIVRNRTGEGGTQNG